jgi:protein-S-isoprenylcysteine O-methyltransferase Ste14
MIVLNRFFPITRWLEFPWRYLGIVFIVIGFTLSIGSGILFRRLGTQPRPGVKASVLVTNGAYRFTRNPMYLGLVTMLVGVSILLGTVSPLTLIPILILILHFKFILREEKWMKSWFGESYLRYKTKTRRWL